MVPLGSGTSKLDVELLDTIIRQRVIVESDSVRHIVKVFRIMRLSGGRVEDKVSSAVGQRFID